MTFVKFCGMTREEDMDAAAGLGVDAVGMVLWPKSPRAIPLDRVPALIRRLPESVLPVGVFVDPTDDEMSQALDAGIRVMQLHGSRAAAIAAAAERRDRDADHEDIPGTSARHRRLAVWVATSLAVSQSESMPGEILLLDAHDPERHGGTGRTIDWARAAGLARRRRVLLAGGLTPHNVARAIAQVRPYGVDVASGIEVRPGIKSTQAMQAFMAAVREADQ